MLYISEDDRYLQYRKYYDALAAVVPAVGPRIKIVIAHQCYTNVLPLLEALQEHVGDVVAYVPKGSKDLHPEVIAKLRIAGVRIRDGIQRVDGEDTASAISSLKSLVGRRGDFIILDDGGRFDQSVKVLAKDKNLASRVLGVVEYTKNGELRYKKILNTRNVELTSRIPIISLAEQELKNELLDYDVGVTIVNGVKRILHMASLSSHIHSLETIGLIGLGPIGRGIIGGLQENGFAGKLLVTDLRPDRLEAVAKLSGVPFAIKYVAREQLVACSDFIFSATGAGAITRNDYKLMKENARIATVTSADDELNLPELIRTGTLTPCQTHEIQMVPGTLVPLIQDYSVVGGHRIGLLLNGRSANSIIDGLESGRDTIALSDSLILLAALLLRSRTTRNRFHSYAAEQRMSSAGMLKTLPQEKVDSALRMWARYFPPTRPRIEEFITAYQAKLAASASSLV